MNRNALPLNESRDTGAVRLRRFSTLVSLRRNRQGDLNKATGD